ncbi:MAG: hypothetical protein ACFB0B_10455 [Thermonemataceae bacterium]
MKKYLKRFFIGVGVLLLVIFINGLRMYYQVEKEVALPEERPASRLYPKNFSKEAFDSLKNAFGANKILPPNYELQALLALSHYPTLKEVPVTFIVEETLIPLASRPHFWKMFRSKERWEYQVIISAKSSEAMEPILLKNLSFNSQVGILGHELAHTLYYQDKSFWDVVGIGTCYLLSDYRATFEKQTDQRAIAHGLGRHLLQYAKEVRSGEMEGNTEYIDQYYLTPDEIEKLLNNPN